MAASKPRLSFWQIWNMSFGFLGIQFGFGLQNANVSRIFETLGADIDDIPILWVAAPLTGLIVQPIIGHLSDNTWGRLGRRRPFFLIGAILASAALIFMPNSPVLWVAAGMLWIMDASINISMEPFRAFVGDMLPEEQRTSGFAMQTFFIGIGAVIASALPYVMTNWFGISSVAPDGQIPDSVKWSFYIGGAVFLICVLYTVFTTKEYSPEEMAEYEAAEGKTTALGADEDEGLGSEVFMRSGWIWTIAGLVATTAFYFMLQNGYGKKELYVMGALITAYGVAQLLVGTLRSSEVSNGLTEVLSDLKRMPTTMRQLATVQFFSWFALFSMWIYTSNSVSRHYYDTGSESYLIEAMLGAVEKAEPEDEEKQQELREALVQMQGDLNEKGGGSAFTPPKVFKPMAEGVFANENAIADYVLGLENHALTMPDQFYDAEPELASLKASRSSGDDVSISPELLSIIEVSDALPPAQNDEDFAAHLALKKIQSEYNAGGDWVGICFALYNFVAAVVAFLLPILAKAITRRRTHMLCLVAGGLGLILVYFGSHPGILLAAMLGVGAAWASILSMPYAMLAGAIPGKKMGVYMGIFNFFIVIPQLVAASILGFLVAQMFSGDPVYALVIGGLSMIAAGLLSLRVDDHTDPSLQARS